MMLDIVRPPDEVVGAVFAGRLRRGFRVINRCDDFLAAHGARNPLRRGNRRLPFRVLFAGLRQCCFSKCVVLKE